MKKIKLTLALQAILLCLLIVTVTGCVKEEHDNDNNNNDTGTVTDIDGNVYTTVKIGTQTWMAADLKTSKYRDGSAIPNVTDATDWSYLTTGAYCYYENDPAYNTVYGKLYNWHAVNTGLLAPTGWHVPTDAEWTVMENYLGNDNYVGAKLKETGLAHWYDPNEGATNATGFTALPGGSRFSTGSFYNLTYNGYWWTATTGTDVSYAIYRYASFSLTALYNSEDYKTDGISVRCVKD